MNSLISSAILAALVGAIVAGIISLVGLRVNYSLTRKREEEARQIEAALRHLERQIEELYGPILGLIQQAQQIYTLARGTFLAHSVSNGRIDQSRFNSQEDWDKWNYLVSTHFIPLNAQMVDLLRTKAYLIEEKELPPSFGEFLRHAVQQAVLRRLWEEKGLSVSNAPPLGWPSRFNTDVQDTLDRLRENYSKQRADLTSKHGK